MTSTKAAMMFAVFLFILFLFYYLTPVLQPFYFAAIIAYISNPSVVYLEKLKVPRTLAVIIVFVVFFTLITLFALFFIPLLIEQINLLFKKIPLILAWLQQKFIPWLNQVLGLRLSTENITSAIMTGIKENQNMIANILSTVTTSGFTLIAWIFQLLLIPVVAFYLLRDWHKFIFTLRKILPRTIEPTVVFLGTRCNEMLRAFLKGQLMVMGILALIYSLGLWIVGIQFAVLIGIIAGLLNIVPYLGFVVGLLIALISAYYQFGSLTAMMSVIMVFLIAQSIESLLLTPLLVGDRIGLHPVAVIFAVLTGGYLLGFIGALLALPIAAALMVLIRFILNKYYNSAFYS